MEKRLHFINNKSLKYAYRQNGNKLARSLVRHFGIFPYSLGEGVRPISEQTKLASGSSEALLWQMQPHFVAHLEVVWHPMLIMSLLVLSIGSIQYVMKLLVDVLCAQ